MSDQVGRTEAPSVPSAKKRPPKAPWLVALDIIGSMKLAVGLLLYLALLTYLGTLAQVDVGLYRAQETYFNSFFFKASPLGFTTWVPGAQFVLWVFCVNLAVGGILRIRWQWRRAGILITHFGIAFLMAAGFVKYYYSDDGNLTLYEGESAVVFQSHHDKDIVITEQLPDGRWEEFLIPYEQFADLSGLKRRTFKSARLPFTMTVWNWIPNARPTGSMRGMPSVDGVGLRPLGLEKNEEFNAPGCFISLKDKRTGKETETILFSWQGLSTTSWRPYRYESGSRVFGIDLRKRQYPMPYEVKLVDFRRKLYPGTMRAKSYESDVIVSSSGLPQDVNIHMNSPLRKGGLVVFQSGWGPQDGRPGPFYSSFSVVRNPSDQWPLISCLVIAVGLLTHFGFMLSKFILKESRRTA